MNAIAIPDFNAAPERIVELSTTEKYSLDPEDLVGFQVVALRKRFHDLLPRLPILQKFAEENRREDITCLEEATSLLFPHTLYKSYPLSALETGRYDVLTKWLDGFTVTDLSGLDAASCQSIDDWIDLLDAKTDIRVRHSSGTTGKLSFIPASTSESRTTAWGIARGMEAFGEEPGANVSGVGEIPYLIFSHRFGAQGSTRNGMTVADTFYNGKEDRVAFLNPGRFSADILSLGGRMEGARSRGELGKMQLSPALLARRDEFVRDLARQPEILKAFLADVANRFGGKKVMVFGNTHVIVRAAIDGLGLGYKGMFARGSLAGMAGGTKGHAFPSDFENQFEAFAGFKLPPPGYGMSEAVSSMSRLCPHGKYHVPPNIIPYVIDPETGEPRPRTGTQSGRYGIIDIAAQSRWGGFLSSDKVTITWEGRCPCGRKGAFLDGEISRYSEGEGGDDKITCAGAPDVHDRALAFIANALGK